MPVLLCSTDSPVCGFICSIYYPAHPEHPVNYFFSKTHHEMKNIK